MTKFIIKFALQIGYLKTPLPIQGFDMQVNDWYLFHKMCQMFLESYYDLSFINTPY